MNDINSGNCESFERPAMELDKLFEDDNQTVSLITLNGIGDRVRNLKSNMVYKVISGMGYFSISRGDWPGANELHQVKAGDVIEIPKGISYKNGGDLVMLETAEPPFDSAFVEEL